MIKGYLNMATKYFAATTCEYQIFATFSFDAASTTNIVLVVWLDELEYVVLAICCGLLSTQFEHSSIANPCQLVAIGSGVEIQLFRCSHAYRCRLLSKNYDIFKQ